MVVTTKDNIFTAIEGPREGISKITSSRSASKDQRITQARLSLCPTIGVESKNGRMDFPRTYVEKSVYLFIPKKLRGKT